MKIIPVAGWSGSGKTYFITKLCSHLTQIGKTGTIKHISKHVCELPSGKDTTLHYEAGADATIGIDPEKSIAVIHDTDLDSALDLLSDMGVRFAVVEGFKSRPFKKVVIGEMEGPRLLSNPSPEELVEIMDRFDDWYTPGGVVRELKDKCPDIPVLCWSGYVHESFGLISELSAIELELSEDPRISGLIVRVHPWHQNNLCPVYVAVASGDHQAATDILSGMVRFIESGVHGE